VQNPNPLIPPIFGFDEYGYCSEWNASMETSLDGKKRRYFSPFFTFCYNAHFVDVSQRMNEL
jgi:hypothetical protein